MRDTHTPHTHYPSFFHWAEALIGRVSCLESSIISSTWGLGFAKWCVRIGLVSACAKQHWSILALCKMLSISLSHTHARTHVHMHTCTHTIFCTKLEPGPIWGDKRVFTHLIVRTVINYGKHGIFQDYQITKWPPVIILEISGYKSVVLTQYSQSQICLCLWNSPFFSLPYGFYFIWMQLSLSNYM